MFKTKEQIYEDALKSILFKSHKRKMLRVQPDIDKFLGKESDFGSMTRNDIWELMESLGYIALKALNQAEELETPVKKSRKNEVRSA